MSALTMFARDSKLPSSLLPNYFAINSAAKNFHKNYTTYTEEIRYNSTSRHSDVATKLMMTADGIPTGQPCNYDVLCLHSVNSAVKLTRTTTGHETVSLIKIHRVFPQHTNHCLPKYTQEKQVVNLYAAMMTGTLCFSLCDRPPTATTPDHCNVTRP